MWEAVNVAKEGCEHRPITVFIKHEKDPIYGKNNRLIGYGYRLVCLSADQESTACLLCEKCLRKYCEVNSLLDMEIK